MEKLKVIAHIHTDFPEKFGVPRQSGLVKGLIGKIVFEPEFRSPDSIKGLEEFTYLWLVWGFDVKQSENFQATVRPPRLGGNETRGVFATRSPFRPNPLGLSSVKLEHLEITEAGPVIYVSGIDMRDNTEIYDIKPYLEYADSHPEASNGFAGEKKDESLSVVIPENMLNLLPGGKRDSLIEVLMEDPRPHYQNDSSRVYGMAFSGFNIRFTVANDVLTVSDIERVKNE